MWDDAKDHGKVTKEKMHDLLLQMNEDTGGAEFSASRIYVRVSGPTLSNMRLVDLPGYQINGKNRDFLASILETELSNPNTVILALGTSDEYDNQIVMEALRSCGVDETSDRVVHCLHRGDEVWNKYEMSDSFVHYIYDFVAGIQRVPLIVGNTAKLNSKGLPMRRLAEYSDGGASLSPEERQKM